MIEKNHSKSASPISTVIKLVLAVLAIEFAIMVVITVASPFFSGMVPALIWDAVDAILLAAGTAPAFYYLALRPMQEQHTRLAQQNALLEQQKNELKISAVTFNAQNGVVITDAGLKILKTNRAFTAITGYSSEEVAGKTPAILNSGRQDKEFYDRMWASLQQDNFWQGELWNRRKSGEIYPEFLTITAVRDENAAVTHYVGMFHDITLSKAAADEVKYMAFYDPLTGLANRRLLTDRMEQMLALSRRTGELVAICMIDLDGFKQVNDQQGHQAGDQLLVEVARRLQECVRQSDTASRLGGDEFALLLGGFLDIGECVKSMNRILSVLSAPYAVSGGDARVTASLGATLFPNDSGSPDQLLRHADESMYEAKHAGKNCYRLFNPSHQNQQEANQATLRKIEKALKQGELTLYYQPQVDTKLSKITGVEALIRWNHPILGLLNPSEFISLIEHDDLIITVGEWVLRQALRQLQEWRLQGLDITVAVNVSARELHDARFLDRLEAMFAEFSPEVVRCLELEILETVMLEDLNSIAATIRICREMGVRIAIDDFGTGYSSLAHLRKIPFDTIKIDQSFVAGMLRNQEDLVIVNSVIGLAKSFKRKVIAEGVESIDHVLVLQELGCSMMQGYEMARPMPAEQVIPWIGKFEPDPLWRVSESPRPSRDYFEMLLAEVNHRQWIDQIVEGPCATGENFDSARLLDYQNCRFGQWYYGAGKKKFGADERFMLMDPVHQHIHQTAARLCQQRQGGDKAGVGAEEANLFVLQEQLISQLRELRTALAEKKLPAQ